VFIILIKRTHSFGGSWARGVSERAIVREERGVIKEAYVYMHTA
jgi:hypothetical protein